MSAVRCLSGLQWNNVSFYGFETRICLSTVCQCDLPPLNTAVTQALAQPTGRELYRPTSTREEVKEAGDSCLFDGGSEKWRAEDDDGGVFRGRVGGEVGLLREEEEERLG